MDINYLRVFYEVAKAGKFSSAAKTLGISQSALSRSVALLEEGEGVQLLERSKKGVALTPIGKEVFRRCEQLFQSFHQIENLCRGKTETCEGTMSFATSDHITNNLLVKPIQEFRALHPLVVPSIFTGGPDEIANALLTTDCEFGLLFTKVPLPQLEFKSIRLEKMALVCAPKVWRKNKAPTDLDTLRKVLKDVGYLASFGAILHSRPARVLIELFGEMPRIGLETNSQEAQKIFALEGGGVAYLARFMVEKEIQEGSLFEIPVGTPHEFYFWVATKKGRQLSLSARTFLAHLERGTA